MADLYVGITVCVVISSPLSLIYKELRALGINIHDTPVQPTGYDAAPATFDPALPMSDGNEYIFETDHFIPNLDLDAFDVTPELFNAMAGIDPISTNVNAGMQYWDAFDIS